RECVVLELPGGDPAKVPHGAAGESEGREPAFVEVQVDRVELVGVTDEGDELPHLHADAQALEHLPTQGIGVTLAWFDPPSWELPQQGEHGVFPTLRDQIPSLVLDDGRHHANGL